MREKTIMREISEKFLALALILVMLITAIPAFTIDVDAAEADVADTAASVTSGEGTWISGKLTYEYSVATDSDNTSGATGSVSASNNTLTVKATSAKEYETGGCSSTTVAAAATTTTVTVTNDSSYPLKFNTLTASGSASVSGVSQGDTIASGATFTITVTSPANGTSATEMSGTVTVSVSEETSVTITLKPSPYVGYTVNGKTVAQNGSDQTFTADVGTSVSLPSISAPSGYEFKGWRIGSELRTNISSFTADAGYNVFPVIVVEGTDTTSANFKVGSNTYTFWEDAVKAALGGGTIVVNATDVTLPDNVFDNALPAAGGTYVKPVTGGGVEYTLPAGINLLVPYSTSNTFHTTEPSYTSDSFATPYAFRTLTVPAGAKFNVSGSICVDSAVMCKMPLSAVPYGPHGKIVMKSGSEMTLNSGANLYCYGYINGDGNVNAKNGSTVYELMQITCWRGGTAVEGMMENSSKVFPLSQYYVQNVEAPLNFFKGAKEYLWTCGYAGGIQTVDAPFPFIGDDGMFVLSSSGANDHITKRYHANVDRLQVAIDGDMTINALHIKISAFGFSMNLDSDDYVLPINNMEIMLNSGTTSISSTQTNGIAILPSSKITVNEGAVFNANAPIYFYDTEEWVGKNYVYGGDLSVCRYSTANGTTAIRTVNNLKDAEMDVNGTFKTSNKGYLYTTEHGANITSSNGTGVINFTTACATGTVTTYQGTQSDTSMTYHGITCNNAWLKNGDDSYSQTVGTGTSKWYYDKSGEHWYRYLVDFKYNSNLISRDYYCEKDDTVTYDASWLTNLGASASNGTATISGTNVNVTGVTADSTVTLTGTPAEYVPTFVLSEEEYTKHYLLYNADSPITDTTTINGETYYIVAQADSALAVGTTYAAPSDASMGVSAENHNTITWNMSGISATSGDPYRGTVPAGETAQGPAYIYGFYSGVVAYNSYTDEYYDTLIGAFEVLPQDVSATITLLADCGTFKEESSTVAYTAYTANNITLDLNGHNAVGRIVNQGNFTLELDGGTLDCHSGASAASATYAGMAAVINSGTMTVQDSVGGGKITTDIISNASGASGSAVIRNNAGATLTVTGKDADHLLPLETTQNVNNYNYGIYNLGTITDLAYVDITTAKSGTAAVNLYNYNTGVVNQITGGHMYSYTNYSVFNYGGTINTIDGLTIDGKYGILTRNIRGGALASGYTVANADIGTIGTIQNCHIEVGQYAINNNAKITAVKNSTFIAHPDSAQVDTRGDGSTASDGNVQCYTVVNSANWWYDTNVWKQVDSSSGGYTRVNYYKEDEQYRPSIGTITNCEIYAENTSTSASYGYALMNYGVIDTIGGTTNVKTYKHPDNAKISVSHYAMQNLNGGIIKSIEGTVNADCTGVGAVYNDAAFTTQINYTYANKVGGNITYQKNTYGEPSTINSITCSGTWSCGGGKNYYYALMNSGYIGAVNSTGLTLRGGYNVLYNAANGANSTYEITKKYTDGATASTEYERDTSYVKNLEKGSTIDAVNGITVNIYGATVYQGINNQGHIGTLSNVNVGFESGATNNTSSYALVLNGDSRYKSYTETIQTNRTPETDPHLTVSAGVVTRYDRDYTYDTPTIDTIDNLTVTSIGTYAFRNAGHIGTLKNSTITGTQYSLHNYANGPYTERQTRQYYSGTGIFTTTKNAGELNKHYKRNPAVIDTIDNCTITTPANTYAMFNSGHVGTIKNSTLTAGTTTAKAYALANMNSQEREYTRDLETILYVTANSGTACTAYYGSGGESDVVTYDYDVPVIDLIGEGNTFKATTTVINNTGTITEINSGEGTLTTITGTTAKGSTLYNYSAVLDSRTTTTPYTAATAASSSGTKGTATNDDVYQSGAQIGTIKNVYINANGYGILNGLLTATDISKTLLPTIGEIGEGTEIYAHCTTAAYHAIANANYAKITEISGGTYTVTKATTNAYRNGYDNAETATLISGGNFKGMSATRDNAIYKPDDTNRVVYPAGKKLSTNSRNVTFNNGTTTASGSGYYYITSLYTVTFNANGYGTAPDSQTIESGQKATEPTAPTATGYRFEGWYKEDSCTNAWNFSTDTVTEDTTLYAKWVEDNSFVVTFDMQGHGTAPDDISASSGETITQPDNPTAAGYTFGGWYKEAECENAWDFENDTVTENTILYAKWTINKYTVTWKNGDTTLETDENVEYGTTPSYDGDTPTKQGDAQYSYTFAGWSTDGETIIVPMTGITGDTTYIAVFTQSVNKYTVTWKNGDTTLETDENVEYGTTPTYDGATPTKDADAQYTYTFAGWSTDGSTVLDAIPAVTGETTYIAVFSTTVNTYSLITYNRYYNSSNALKYKEVATTTDLEYGSTVTPDAAERTGDEKRYYQYKFQGWYVTTYDSTTKKYTPVYDTDQSSLSFAEITPEFLAGKYKAKKYTLSTAAIEIKGETRCFAVFTYRYYIYYYNRYYNSSNALTTSPSSAYPVPYTYKSGSPGTAVTATLTASPTNESGNLITNGVDMKYNHENFLGWYITDAFYNPMGNAAGDAKLTLAKITPEFLYEQYQAGKYEAPNTTSTFDRRILCFAIYDLPSLRQHEITMYDAASPETAITSSTEGYSDVVNSVEYGSSPTAPAKDSTAQYSYSLSGWSTAAEYEAAEDKTTPAHTAEEQLNVVYDAQTYYFYYSSSVNDYTVTWKNGDTTLETDENVTYGTTPSYNGATPTKEADAQYSYTFAGWSTDGTTVIDSLPDVTGDVTYQAVFTKTVNTYTVNWTSVVPAADEATTKAAVDALIAEVAQRIYNDAKTEGDMAWNFLSHETLVKYHLNAGGVPTANSSDAYITKRIIEIVENGSADFSAADALWDTCKDTIAADFAAFSGYSSGDTGTAYSGLTAEQKNSMEALAGGETTIETDNSVPYGTVPTFDGTTPTKEGDAQYSYTFAGWSTDGTTVIDPLTGITGDTTYIAVFTQTLNTYTVTWDVDGVTTTSDVEYGSTPVYNNGVNPTKESANGITYLFAGWTPTIVPVTGNVTYTAVFQSEKIFNRHSLTLDGNIGVNFYMLLPDGYDETNTTMDFSWGNKYISTNTYSETEPYTKNDVEGTAVANSDYVKFTVPVAAKELNDEITAVLKDSSGNTIATDIYRGTDYAYDLLVKTDDELSEIAYKERGKELRALLINMLIYSADAQVNFKYNSSENENFSDLATYRFEELEFSDALDAVDTSKLSGNTIGDLPSGVSYYGSSLNLGSETSYMIVFRNNNKLDLTLTATYAGTDTELATSVKNSGAATGLSVLNLPAARVLDDVAITIKNGSEEYEATVNTGTYFKTVLNGSYAQELKDVITALYHYNSAAKEYFD